MATLREMEVEWIKLADDLDRDTNQVAAPFFSNPPISTPSILYVGKATDGDWCRNSFRRHRSTSMKERQKERHKKTQEFVTDDAPTKNSAFWRFAQLLSKRSAQKLNKEIGILQNLVWTNICKIGVIKGVPRGKFLRLHQDLAVETLRLEIESYRPSLVYFVTAGFGEDVIAHVVRDPAWGSWHCSPPGMWWRSPQDGLPAVLWTDHPQGKSMVLREKWLTLACNLLPS